MTSRIRPSPAAWQHSEPTEASADACAWCGLPVTGLRQKTRTNDVGNEIRSDTHESSPVVSSDVYCCYGCRVAHAITQERGTEGAVRWTSVRLGLSIFFTMNLMAFTMTMWSLDVYDVQPDPFQQKLFEVFRWLSMLFGLPVLLLLGLPLLQSAVASWRQRIYSTDLLIATGVASAYVASVASVLQGRSEVYFEVGAMVLLAVTLGRWFEAAGRQKATQELDKLSALLPESVCRLSPEGDTPVASREVQAGDHLRVNAGDRFPVDGTILVGQTTVDQQVFSGESIPIARQPGEPVLAGTINLDTAVIICATAPFRGGSFGRLLQLLQEARLARGHYQRLADRVSAWFFPIISITALAVFAVYLSRGFGVAIQNSLSVLLIACPCALGLATPLAIWTALSAAVRHQILFRSGDAIERLAEAQSLCLDKTGTLTTGLPQVNSVTADIDHPLDETEWWLVRHLASSSRHPFSAAIARFCDQRNAESQSPDSVTSRRQMDRFDAVSCVVRAVAGEGMECADTNGTVWRLGRVSFVRGDTERNGDLPMHRAAEPHFNAPDRCADPESDSLVGFGCSGRLLLLFSLSESLRPETTKLLSECRRLQIPLTVLTGDRKARAERLEAELRQMSGNSASHPGGALQDHTTSSRAEFQADDRAPMRQIKDLAPLRLEVRSELSPEGKVQAVRDIRQRWGRVMMAGDGINDAPALSASDVGIAMGCGADVARDSAHVCLLSNDLSRIPWAIQLARRTRSVIRQNLLWAFGYNSLGVILAAAGFLNPALAAGLMIVSSLLVITNSLRLMSFEIPGEPAAGRLPLNTEWQPSQRDQRQSAEPDATPGPAPRAVSEAVRRSREPQGAAV